MLLNRLRPFVVVQDNRSLEASLRRFKTYETTWKVKSDSAVIEETEHMLQKRFGKKEAKRYAEELRAKGQFCVPPGQAPENQAQHLFPVYVGKRTHAAKTETAVESCQFELQGNAEASQLRGIVEMSGASSSRGTRRCQDLLPDESAPNSRQSHALRPNEGAALVSEAGGNGKTGNRETRPAAKAGELRGELGSKATSLTQFVDSNNLVQEFWELHITNSSADTTEAVAGEVHGSRSPRPPGLQSFPGPRQPAQQGCGRGLENLGSGALRS